jgi:MSHA pilin protein MshD
MGQTLLVLGALVVLSLAVLSANQLMLEKLTASYDTQATVAAISLAQAEIDEIQRKDFDENSIAKRIYYATDMTPVSLLGPDAGETSRSLYDDVDDYNNDSTVVSTATLDNFTEQCKVEYVTEADPDVVSSTQTFYKRITVTVTHPNMQYPVVMTSLVVYRRFF